MKRVLLVSPFPPYIGGVSVSVQRLYEHLRQKGYEVEKYNTQISKSNLNLRPLKFMKYLSLPLYLASARRFDVVHFHVSDILPKFYVALWRPLFRKDTRFIITIHGQVRHTLTSGAGKYALGRFDRIICVKKGDARHMPPGIREKTVEIPAFIPPVMNGSPGIPADLEKFLDTPDFRLLLNGFIVVNDSFRDLYGYMDAIVLLENLLKTGRKAVLVLIVLNKHFNSETRAYLRELKDYVLKRNLSERVFWVENVEMELWPLLRKVSVLLRPTKSDGDALSVREALYVKVPVISSNAVPRPAGSLVYKLNSKDDLLKTTIRLIDNYENYVSCISASGTNFAVKIIEQYENQ